MNELTINPDDMTVYEAPRVLATFEAGEILAEAETGSVVVVIT